MIKFNPLKKKEFSSWGDYEKDWIMCKHLEDVFNYTIQDIGIDAKQIYDMAFYGQAFIPLDK